MEKAAAKLGLNSKAIKRKLRFELINILFNQIQHMLWAEIFAATLMLFVLWWNGHYPHKQELVLWYVSMILFTGLPRYLLAKFYKNASLEEKQKSSWENYLMLMLFITGLGWSIIGTILLPMDNPLNEAIVLFLLIGVAAAANPFYSPLKKSYAAFIGPSLFITAAYLLVQGSNYHIFAGSALLSFAMLMLITSIISSGLIANSLKLNFENFELTKSLIKTNRSLTRLATTDSLTGLPNRQSFSHKLSKAIESAPDKALALLFLDLDNFKQVNDSLGHDAGDKLIQIIAERLQDNLRPEDVAGRLGGDEFLILLNDAHPEKVAEIAEKICQSANYPIEIYSQQFNMSASIGIALYPTNGKDAQTLIKNADIAMYKIKKAAKGNYKFFNPEIQK